jgi:hypothetical protein
MQDFALATADYDYMVPNQLHHTEYSPIRMSKSLSEHRYSLQQIGSVDLPE